MRETIKTEIVAAILVITTVLALGAGCAKIGEPQPPEIHIPKSATDLAAHQISDCIVLTVTKPAQNTDGSAATTLAKVDVFRLSEEANPSVSQKPLLPEEFVKRAVRILTIPASGPSTYLQGNSFVIQDKLDIPDRSSIYSHAFRYAVLFINKKNQTAGFSNQALIMPVAIPSPPTGLAAKVTENSISLKWPPPTENMDGSKPPRIAGYKIYRVEGTQEFPSAPINPDLVQRPEFEDRDFHFDKTYKYVVRIVGNLQDPYAESLPSEILTVEARDVFPPAPPESFSAIREGGSIILLWSPSPSTDVAGYRIYRLDKQTATRLQLQKELITVLNYRDNQVDSGREYEYSIRALDTHGNESIEIRAEVETR